MLSRCGRFSFAPVPMQESKAPSGNSKRKTPARFGSCKRSNFLPLTQTLKPPNPPTSPRLGSETRDRDIIRLKSRYCIRPRVLSYPRAVRTCHGSGKLSCLSRVVLHTFASLSHLSHLKVFGTFLLYSIRTSDLHSRPDQPCRWPPSSLQSPIRPSSQTNTMRSSWASPQSWIPNRTSALFT